MKISVILAHPYEKSFNHAIAKKVIETLENKNYEVYFHDLYLEDFDPIITCNELANDSIAKNPLINQHCKEITDADGIIIIHPNWWGQPPAILKGWVDRVLRPGIAYNFEENESGGGLPTGLLNASIAIVFNTSNTEENRELNVFKDPLETIWKNCIFDFCGIKNFHRKMFRIVADSNLSERNQWLNEVEQTLCQYF